MQSLDDEVTYQHVRAAVSALKDMRGRAKPLDVLVDALPKQVAHVAEEALRANAGGRGLWRHTGSDTELISLAIKWLNSCHFRNGRIARTRPESKNDHVDVPGSDTPPFAHCVEDSKLVTMADTPDSPMNLGDF